MEFEQAEARAMELGFTIHSFNGERNWFNALKTWDYTGQTFSLQVWTEEEKFEFSRMEGAIQISTGKLGSYNNDVHFLSWQRSFMEVIEKLVRK
ncbi:hypothetical protein PDK22_26160 [Bacillus cereus group sp. BY122LC]|uniref:hypothetical protein n=1 Tax=Bacillus cereus group sp. BY122LC TaxID=3018085 RepID=UPI0022E13A3D|nr:hypothetical protein [Bacillus cereus group sp. BY122LC]MDA1861174.1 hypothetical protein [Bacillus cereus group sp. BY122LC]